jgi:hypothetical protein
MAVDPQKLRVNRNELAKFLPDPRSVRQFEKLLDDFVDVATAVIAAQATADAAAVVAATADAAAAAADAAAVAANAAAAAANTAAAQVTADSSLANSFATGLTVTATDAGANATITMSAHTRVYGDGTSVAVNGGAVTGLLHSTAYWVYYDQASRLGGAVTYAASTSVQGNGTSPDRHFIGAVTTPAPAGGPNNGNPVRPPGFAEP